MIKDYSVNKLAHRKMILRLFNDSTAVKYSEMRELFRVGDKLQQTCDCIEALNFLKESGIIKMVTTVYGEGNEQSRYYLTKDGLDAKL